MSIFPSRNRLGRGNFETPTLRGALRSPVPCSPSVVPFVEMHLSGRKFLLLGERLKMGHANPRPAECSLSKSACHICGSNFHPNEFPFYYRLFLPCARDSMQGT